MSEEIKSTYKDLCKKVAAGAAILTGSSALGPDAIEKIGVPVALVVLLIQQFGPAFREIVTQHGASLKDIAGTLREIRGDLGRVVERVEDHETRLDALENRKETPSAAVS